MQADAIKNMVTNAGTIQDARFMCFNYLMGCHETGNVEFAARAAEAMKREFEARFGKPC